MWFDCAVQHEIVLVGYGFRLEPLSQAHVGALAKIVDQAMWSGMATPTPVGEVGMANYIEDALSAPDVFAFAVIDTINNEVCGSTAYCGVDEAQGRLEIGRTFYDRAQWGRVVNPACKFLLLEYAFETWGMYRTAMRADSRNSVRSARSPGSAPPTRAPCAGSGWPRTARGATPCHSRSCIRTGPWCATACSPGLTRCVPYPRWTGTRDSMPAATVPPETWSATEPPRTSLSRND